MNPGSAASSAGASTPLLLHAIEGGEAQDGELQVAGTGDVAGLLYANERYNIKAFETVRSVAAERRVTLRAGHNEVIIPRAESWRWMERISRKACAEVGSIASTCKAPRSGREVKDHAILYTTTQAIDLGRAVMAARDAHYAAGPHSGRQTMGCDRSICDLR